MGDEKRMSSQEVDVQWRVDDQGMAAEEVGGGVVEMDGSGWCRDRKVFIFE